MKLKNTDFFLLLLAFIIAINGIKIVFLTYTACFLHELGHIIALKLCKCDIKKIRFLAVGLQIESNRLNNIGVLKQIFVFSSGVLINLFLVYLSHFLAYKGIRSYDFFIFSALNFYLLVLNLLPISILDGGQILRIILNKIFKTDKACRIFDEISFLTTILLILFSFSLIFKGNYAFFVTSIYLYFSEKYK